ncbi:TonB-dependent siderophore receptor, partial [Arthrobacter stackebrandtii]
MSNTRQSHPALALAVHLALGAMYMAGGNTVAASAAQEQTRSYDIAPGSLTETLGQFASAAGVTLSFDGASTEGRRSAGLRGSYSVAGGFATLLAGRNLQAVRQANGIYLLVDG